jgi:hypothetical protein
MLTTPCQLPLLVNGSLPRATLVTPITGPARRSAASDARQEQSTSSLHRAASYLQSW